MKAVCFILDHLVLGAGYLESAGSYRVIVMVQDAVLEVTQALY